MSDKSKLILIICCMVVIFVGCLFMYIKTDSIFFILIPFIISFIFQIIRRNKG